GPDPGRVLPHLLASQPGARRLDQLPGLTLRSYAGDHHEHGAHGHDDHDHAPGTIDPHIWLSTANAGVIARWMAADLAQLHPEHATRLQANAADFSARLEQLQ